MADGNLTAHLDELRKKYEELRAKGVDLYTFSFGRWPDSNWVVPLPDDQVKIDSDGRVVLDEKNLAVITQMFKLITPLTVESAKEKFLDVQPYVEGDYIYYNLSMNVLERALHGQPIKTYEVDYENH